VCTTILLLSTTIQGTRARASMKMALNLSSTPVALLLNASPPPQQGR